ncbi:hypothetical protein [Natronospora cellulosivora (SeqCode)]
MSEESTLGLRRRRPCHPKRTDRCTAHFDQVLECEFAVTFVVEIPDVELLNVTCAE